MTGINNKHEGLKSMGLVVGGLALNLICGQIVSLLNLPFYFDCVGTIAAALIGGFLPGVLVGFLTNIVSVFADKYNIYYAVVNVLIALVAAGFSQMGYFRKITWKIIFPVIGFILLGGGIGSVISWGLFGNSMGEELSSTFAGKIYSNLIANAFWAQLYAGLIMDIPDKIISTAIAVLI